MTKAEIWNLKTDLQSLFSACKESVEYGEPFSFFSKRDILSQIEAVKNEELSNDLMELKPYFSLDKRELLLVAFNKADDQADQKLIAYVADSLRELSEWYEEKEREVSSAVFSDTLLRLFRNDRFLLYSFIKKCRKECMNQPSICYEYKKLGDKVIQPKQEHGLKKQLHEQLSNIGLINIGYDTFKTYL